METHTNAEIAKGVKRRAEDQLDNAQRLAKRFHLLNIENNGSLWVQPAKTPVPKPHVDHAPSSPPAQEETKSEHMHLDDTKDRVYIHNLDEELAEASQEPEEEDRLIFIPDIERRLNKVPQHVLMGDRDKDVRNELVLYQIPESLTIPKEQDSVRKAIIEARARARERQDTHPSHDALLHSGMEDMEAPEEVQSQTAADIFDQDAMDLG